MVFVRLRNEFCQIRMQNNGAEALNLLKSFYLCSLQKKGTFRAALTFQDLSSDTKFGPSQSRETLPLILFEILLASTRYVPSKSTKLTSAWQNNALPTPLFQNSNVEGTVVQITVIQWISAVWRHREKDLVGDFYSLQTECESDSVRGGNSSSSSSSTAWTKPGGEANPPCCNQLLRSITASAAAALQGCINSKAAGERQLALFAVTLLCI